MSVDKTKSIEDLEGEIWGESDFDSFLILRCHELRKKELLQFNIEDLRIMISQNIGLKYLVPIGIEKLNSNILFEGDYYKGDLLKSMLNIPAEYWNDNPSQRTELCRLFAVNEKMLLKFETTNDIREQLFRSYQILKKDNGK